MCTSENNETKLINILPKFYSYGAPIISKLDMVRPLLKAKVLQAPDRKLALALAYIFVSAYKTFRALYKLSDPAEAWGHQASLFARMLFENFVTARWIADVPQERASLFVDFEPISEVQAALLKRELEETFLNPQIEVSPEIAAKWRREEFFRVLPMYSKEQVRTKKDLSYVFWTKKKTPSMIHELKDENLKTRLQEDYDILYRYANAVAHTTPFAARSHISEDLEFRFEPDPMFAGSVICAGIEYIFRLGGLLDEFFGFRIQSDIVMVVPELRQAVPK